MRCFSIANDTDKWAVCVDDQFQMFGTKAEAEAIYEELVPGSIEESPFGSCQLLPPGTCPAWIGNYTAKLTQLSEHRNEATDLLAYRDLCRREITERIAAKQEKDRLAWEAAGKPNYLSSFFDDEDLIDD